MGHGRSQRIEKLLRKSDLVCPACGYSLRGLPRGVCPECGNEFSVAWVECQNEVLPIHWTQIASSLFAICVSTAVTVLLTVFVAPSDGSSIVLYSWLVFGWSLLLGDGIAVGGIELRYGLAVGVHGGLVFALCSTVWVLLFGA